MLTEALNVIGDRIDMLTLFIAPEMGRKYHEMKQVQKHRNELDAESFEENFESLKDFIPQSLNVTYDDKNNKSPLPKVDRRVALGIVDERSE